MCKRSAVPHVWLRKRSLANTCKCVTNSPLLGCPRDIHPVRAVRACVLSVLSVLVHLKPQDSGHPGIWAVS